MSCEANISAVDSFGNTLLHIAALCGEESVALLLLAHGALAGEKNQFEWAPLHYAAYIAYESLLKLLLDNSKGYAAETRMEGDFMILLIPRGLKPSY